MQSILFHCNGMAEERKEMVMLMIEIVEGWQEMEGKDKVVCVVDRACENGRVRRKWRGCIRLWGEAIGLNELKTRPYSLFLF